VSFLKYANADGSLKMLRRVGTPKSADDPARMMTTILGNGGSAAAGTAATGGALMR
jgi:hypothetical protein